MKESQMNISFKANYGGYHAGLLLVFLPDTARHSILNRGIIFTDSNACPLDKVYLEIVQRFSERYGPSPGRGYPTTYSQGIIGPPTEEGQSYIWQVWTKEGQLVNITVSLQAQKKNGDPRKMMIAYENVSVSKDWSDELDRIAKQTIEAAGTWIMTDKGYKVWSALPQPNETVTWSGGADENGYCTGNGVLEWFQRGQPRERYEGEMLNGKKSGKGIATYTNGQRYEGDFVDGEISGKGIYNYGNGARYEGDFVDNKHDGYGTFYYNNGTVQRGRWFKNTYLGP